MLPGTFWPQRYVPLLDVRPELHSDWRVRICLLEMVMGEEEQESRKFTGLPLSVVGPVDIGRLLRELEHIDNSLVQLSLRSPGQEVKMPKTSKMMDDVIIMNRLNLLQKPEREELGRFLEAVRAKAPTIHISFGADPTPRFTERLMVYLRKEIHPLLLLTIGLQPTIGAGCIVRTTNKYFDLSLGKDFGKYRDILMAKLNSAAEPADAPHPAATANEPQGVAR